MISFIVIGPTSMRDLFVTIDPSIKLMARSSRAINNHLYASNLCPVLLDLHGAIRYTVFLLSLFPLSLISLFSFSITLPRARRTTDRRRFILAWNVGVDG
jgi:hypothetical protein